MLPGGKESRVRGKILGFFERWTIYFDAEQGEPQDSEIGVARFLKDDYGPFIDNLWNWETLRQQGSEDLWYDVLAGPPEDLGDSENLAEIMVLLLGYAHSVYENEPVDEEVYELQLDALEADILCQ